ncbi:MAG: LON peptidase substrate-binding domain-containing protein, partial [Deltaproteobacteria bacterium]|nr:LON peptidase substrate-binding domain-containing protein [Deltaproteobacteria bacterium]
MLPMLPLREVVVFPRTPMSLIVGRPRSLSAVNAALLRPDREIFLAAQRNGDRVNPELEDIYLFGTVAVIEQVLNLPDGNTKILVEGRRRARVLHHVENAEWFEVAIQDYAPGGEVGPELAA